MQHSSQDCVILQQSQEKNPKSTKGHQERWLFPAQFYIIKAEADGFYLEKCCSTGTLLESEKKKQYPSRQP